MAGRLTAMKKKLKNEYKGKPVVKLERSEPKKRRQTRKPFRSGSQPDSKKRTLVSLSPKRVQRRSA